MVETRRQNWRMSVTREDTKEVAYAIVLLHEEIYVVFVIKQILAYHRTFNRKRLFLIFLKKTQVWVG